MRSFIFKSILTFFIILTLVQSEKNSTFVHNSVARYHIKFVNGNSDSVYKFQQRYSQIVEDRYVYIAYLPQIVSGLIKVQPKIYTGGLNPQNSSIEYYVMRS